MGQMTPIIKQKKNRNYLKCSKILLEIAFAAFVLRATFQLLFLADKNVCLLKS